MDHNREAGKVWREWLSEWLIDNLGVIPFNPYNKPLHPMHMMGLEDDENYKLRKEAIARLDKVEARRLAKPVVHSDLRLVDHSDFLICYLDVENNPCGTYDEAFTAADQNKPVIVMCPQGVHRIPDWCWGRLKFELFFDDWGDIKGYLKHIAFDDNVNDLGKWKFFNIKDTILRIVENERLGRYTAS